MSKTIPHRTTPDDRRRIADLYRSGTSLDDIVAETGWASRTVYSALTREGVEVRRRPRRSYDLTTAQRNCEVCEMPLGYVPPSKVSRGAGRFCSSKCMGEAKRLPPSLASDEADELLCGKCDEMKPVEEFYPHKTTARGRQYWCKTCCQAARRERAKIPQDPRLTRRYKLKEAYGITPEDYDAMYEQQDGCCAICKTRKGPWGPGGLAARQEFLVVDHDHSTGKVRGLLCWNCNCGIGHLKEDPTTMHAAAAYLGWDSEPAAKGRLF